LKNKWKLVKLKLVKEGSSNAVKPAKVVKKLSAYS
jgi:hypothetical protein